MVVIRYALWNREGRRGYDDVNSDGGPHRANWRSS